MKYGSKWGVFLLVTGLFRNFASMFVATIGFFDGVHLGHQCLIGQLRNQARLRGEQCMVVSFDNHPREVVQVDYVPQLLTLAEEKERLLRETGVDDVVLLHFTPELSRLSSQDFMLMLRERYGVDTLLIGYDHRFGHDGGTFADYVQRGKTVGVEVLLASELEGQHVSSRVIRQLLTDGDVATAGRLLSRPYSVEAEVAHGYQVGRTLGFPTANLVWPIQKLLPKGGVYAVRATLQDGTQWSGMLNIGNRPTIDNGRAISVEVHLLDFKGDLYGQRVTVEFLARIRSEQRFDSREALAAQLQRDLRCARELISLNGVV